MKALYRLKNLKALEVFDKSGKKIGEVEDIAIDYYEKNVLGFIMPKKFLSKKNFFSIEDIIIFGDTIVIDKISVYEGLKFSDIKGFNIINTMGKIIGNIEDLIIDKDFKILAMIGSKGFFYKFVNGKDIFLLQNSILGKRNILYLGKDEVEFKSLPHSIWREKNA